MLATQMGLPNDRLEGVRYRCIASVQTQSEVAGQLADLRVRTLPGARDELGPSP
jgi:hypothetical protein